MPLTSGGLHVRTAEMQRALPLATLVCGFFPRLLLTAASAADMPASVPLEIPPSARRPVMLEVARGGLESASTQLPRARLPEGYRLERVAGPPLVTHPMAACIGGKGRLFVADAVGVNWRKADLEARPPNRVLLLEDRDGDGVFDRSTVFADGMTFPQGAQWLDGSLYVASPPGIWKLTDTDGDGVADVREQIVTGFDYTGNAADVHGPFLHPNGRLYWCHGRKTFRVTDGAGRVLHEGGCAGVWSARSDGSDVQWHSLAAGDNPVEIDFTPEGDVVGVQNLYYSQPRGDTVVHWLPGGVYERADLPQVIAGRPRTLETMPVLHNFGHVAVSGACFWRHCPEDRGHADALQFLVTHFNTQRVVRIELTPEGSTYRATENEFLKLEDPDMHLTDVLEDRDGSLLVVDTGGWFRIGCPSSLMAKPEVPGAIYRIRPPAGAPAVLAKAWAVPYRPAANVLSAMLGELSSPRPAVVRRALAQVAEESRTEPEVAAALRSLMGRPLDAPLEHALLWAAQRTGAVKLVDCAQARSPLELSRLMLSVAAGAEGKRPSELVAFAAARIDDKDAVLARTALRLVVEQGEPPAELVEQMRGWLSGAEVSAERLRAVKTVAGGLLRKKAGEVLVGAMLRHPSAELQRAGLEVIVGQPSGPASAEWIEPLETLLASPSGPPPLLLDALRKLRAPQIDAALDAFASDSGRPAALRLKALDAMATRRMTPELVAMLLAGARDPVSAATRIEAARILGAASLTDAQIEVSAWVLATAGPVELKELLPIVRRTKSPAVARRLAESLAANPALASQQESVYRTLFQSHPPELFEQIILPALRREEVHAEAKRRQISPLAEKAAAVGGQAQAAGRALFLAGRGSCVACHRVGDAGRAIGPDLSRIGSIRTERDLVESILFPSNTLARDYEAHVVELRGGSAVTGVIRSHTAEGLLVVEVSGEERNVPLAEIVSDTVLTQSLMPSGLDATLSERELVEMVAWLRSLQ